MTTKAAKAAMTKARNFPTNTCPASRHAQQLAETLMGSGPTWHVTDDRQHSGESIAATVTALWKAREEIAALRKDAERYRWLRAQHWNTAQLCVVCDPKDAVKLGRTCPSGDYLDLAIDDAMLIGRAVGTA